MRYLVWGLGFAAAATLTVAAPANAQVKVKLEEVASGLTHPLAMVPIPDDSGRTAIIEQTGQVRIMDARGRVLPEPMLDIKNKLPPLHSFFDERGLLGIAFHPQFRTNGKFYVAYSAHLNSSDLAERLWFSHTNVVSEFTVSKADPNKADTTRERIISSTNWPQFNHNGHWIGFGPDNMLYISTGDGGYANDWGIGHNPAIGNGQDLKSPLGKILRVNVDSDNLVPADNPFVGNQNADPRIWAYGLRNPWRCSFDMGGNRDLICADVQQNSFEEVNIITKGGNFGWRRMEADKCFNYLEPDKHPASCDTAGLVMPIMTYKNCTAQKDGCMGISITGGYAYRGPNAAFAGKYIFGDWSKSFAEMDGQLFIGTRGADGKWTMERAAVDGMAKVPYILAFGQDAKGEVYALTSISTGPVGGHDKIYRVVPTSASN
jgi:glucose/arabinose dehydrogenase